MSWIRSNRIAGMLFLSGDRHLADLSCLRDSAFYPLYDFTSSPLTAGVSSSRKQEENALSMQGKFVNDTRNFGMLKFDGPKNDRRLTMELYDNNGKLRWSHVVKASELKSPPTR
jgi:alkaline phosphatase D